MANLEMKDIFKKIISIKSALDGYRPFSEHVVKQLRDYYRIERIIVEMCGEEPSTTAWGGTAEAMGLMTRY